MLLNNLTLSTIQDVRYFASELDDCRYVNVPVTGRDDDRYVTFLQLNETTIVSIPRNDRTTSFQIISAKLKCSVKCDANEVVSVFHITDLRCVRKNLVVLCQRTSLSFRLGILGERF